VKGLDMAAIKAEIAAEEQQQQQRCSAMHHDAHCGGMKVG